MALIRIGETLHCHIPAVQASARRLLLGDALDREAGERHLRRIVRDQAGADYMDINVDDFLVEEGIGPEGSRQILGLILDLIARCGGGIAPCIDSSDPEILTWGLERYYQVGRDQRPPLLNSVTVSRLDALSLRAHYPFAVVGMLLEQVGSVSGFTEIAGPEVYHQTARHLFERARRAGFAPDEIFFDPTVGPLGADMVGYTRRTFEGIRNIRSDPEMEGVHVCLGLSNCSEGLPRRLAVNRAYLRVAMEYGADAAIADVLRISGEDLVDGRLLRLIRQVVEGDPDDALTLLVDYAQGHPRPAQSRRREPLPDAFGQSLDDSRQPVYVLETVPGEANVEQILEMAEAARDTPFTLSVTDTPGGHRAPGPDALALEVGRITGRQPIVNLSCKSDDRNGLFQRALALYHQGLRHVFAVTGDYPQHGRASFDLDAVTLLMALDGLRRGLDYPSLQPRPGGALPGLRLGAAVSPFKYLESDLWGQYLKLWKKRRAGADYFITQLGFDVAKFHELKLYMQRANMADVPVLGMVYFLTPQVLKILDRVHVAGVVIPDELKQKYQGKLLPKGERNRLRKLGFAELAEHQHHFSVRQAALLADILVRGLGYRGVDFGGITAIDDALEILEIIDQLQDKAWRENLEEYREGKGQQPLRPSPEAGFYLFPENGDGLLRDGPLQSADRRDYVGASRKMERLHGLFFEKDRGLQPLLKWMVSGPAEGRRQRLVDRLESALKTGALGCETCGDCRIADLHYMCPEPTRGCAKRLLNGPCGGADVDGMCEVHPQRRCYWGRVLEAALHCGDCADLAPIQPPKDPQLQHTSSWRSQFQGLRSPKLDLGPFDQQPPSSGG
ncbi:MAG: methylenetetrahydrofolate reductase C-terminal domain-containing protein [Candidatus Latescibacteria bacterium]|nr:methylenetetrahydrofolate reductase C-terminal domain-containing protein [Candidatus Latescibacterota bacterium]